LECVATVVAPVLASLGPRAKATEAFSAEGELRYCFSRPAPRGVPISEIIREESFTWIATAIFSTARKLAIQVYGFVFS